MTASIRRRVARIVHSTLAPEADDFPAERLRGELCRIIDERVVDRFLEDVSSADRGIGEVSSGSPVDLYGDERRAERGMYMTPPGLADGLAAAGRLEAGHRVVDLSAGTGQLLVAAIDAEAGVAVTGVEREAPLALVAAARIRARRLEGRGRDDRGADRIFAGDGLAAEAPWTDLEGRVDAVVANPPYVGEKGNRELFERIARQNSAVAEHVGPRIDLAYLFVHRSLDYLTRGGRLALLTSAYWLSATGAGPLRVDLADRSRPRLFVRAPEARFFQEAPGHHSLLAAFERRSGSGSTEGDPPVSCTLAEPPEEWSATIERLVDRPEEGEVPEPGATVVRPSRSAFGDGPWSVFTDETTADWAERLDARGTPLSELLVDRQGFVSGADRVSARRLSQLDEPPDRLEQGDPVFVWSADELDESMERARGTVLRPLLRGSRIRRDAIRLDPPETDFALYIDGEIDGEVGGTPWPVAHMEGLRPALASRREVRRGTMPWYRLHWPRSRAEQTMPKLVVPRRAPEPTFQLDLSASAVSSDCTYLVAPDGVDRPIRYLIRLMLLLNRPAVGRYLTHFGKKKGDLLEFYAEPLRSLPMPVRPTDGRLAWVDGLVEPAERRAIDRAVDDAMARLKADDLPGRIDLQR